MKANEAESNGKTSVAKSHKGARYTKATDARKRPIRGLWIRGERHYARLAIEDDLGKKQVRWIPLLDQETKEPVRSTAEAVAALNRLKVQREDHALPVLSRTPKFNDFADSYFEHLRQMKDAKRESTVQKEEAAVKLWKEVIGHFRLDKIRKPHVTAFMAKRQGAGISGRTVNLDVIALRNVLKKAVDDGYIKTLPMENLRPLKWTPKTRGLTTMSDVSGICQAAFEVTKNAVQFSDYIRLLAFSGARRNEGLRLRWEDVDWNNQQLVIGADGLAKNREARRVDFNPKLEAHLKDMFARRAPDSCWLFPSPQRGDKDIHAKTFKESLNASRKEAGLPRFGFHDCRHFFISFCVMSGIDFMTVAKWVGHKDGGVLIGRVYGHLAAAHTRLQAQKLNFEPVVAVAQA